MSAYRDIATSWLNHLNPDLSLDDNGTCYLRYGSARGLKFNVPRRGNFFHFSAVLAAAPVSGRLLSKALQLNIHQEKTNGGAVAIDPLSEDLVFGYRHSFVDCDFVAFRNILANFAETVEVLAQDLEQVGVIAEPTASVTRGLPRHGVFC